MAPKRLLRSPVRILHTARGLGINGITNVILGTISHLDNRFDSEVCSVYADDMRVQAFRSAGARVHSLGHSHPVHAPRSLARLVRLIRDRRIELVHTNQTVDLLLAGAAAKLCRVPVVATVHWMAGSKLGDAPARERITQWTKILVRALAEHGLTNAVTTVSAAVRDSHVDLLGRLFPVGRCRVVYPGIHVGRLPTEPPDDWDDLRARIGDDAYPLIVNVGRLDPAKGQEHLLPMMSQVLETWPRARLLIAGDGELRHRLARGIHDQGLEDEVHLLGWRTDVDRLMSVSDVVVVSSVTEAFPLPVMEAMRAERPVVASAVGGVPEMMESGVHGSVVPPGDPDALARGLLEVVSSPARARAMGANGRREVERVFDVRRTIEDLEQVYDSLLEG